MALLTCQTITDQDGRELTQHGTALFPIGVYQDNLAYLPVPCHWHEELEAAIVTSGRLLLTAGGEKQFLDAGDGFFVNSNVLHSAQAAEGSDCHLHSMSFHSRLVSGGMDSIFYQSYVHPLLTGNNSAVFFHRAETWHRDALAAIETAWERCAAEQPGYEFEVRAALSRLIFLLASHNPPARIMPSEKTLRNGQRIRVMLQYIQAHYCDALDISQIAGAAAISQSECIRCFHHMLGIAPMQYVRQLRLRKAVRLLSGGDMPITEVAVQCGFQDMSYFSKVFRLQYGCTPTEFRKKAAKRQKEAL